MPLSEPDWCGCEEDHAFRSQVIQWLLHQKAAQPTHACSGTNVIPRVIVQYWHDHRSLPSDVEACLNSWQPLSRKGFQQELFDDERARLFIMQNFKAEYVDAFDLCYHPAMRCDYFRLCYVLRCGGFYVDADEVYQGTECESLLYDGRIKLQPLCYDTATEAMVTLEECLNDTRCPSSRIFYLNNNPLIAPAGHPLLNLALQRATRILLQRTERPDIQSTTGPGNLSASLVRHVINAQQTDAKWEFSILRNWERISTCRWFLSYRNDERNWRLLKTK